MSEEIKEIKNEDLNEKENTNLDENKEVVIDKLPDENKASDEKQKKKKFTIFGFTIIQILAYFIIYSIIGFVIETLFGLLTKGVVESRKSFLYGPFCGIYGLGAVVMIIGLQKFKKNNYTLFARWLYNRISFRICG